MKRNKQTEQEKEYLKLRDELDDLLSVRRGKSYIELEEPIHHGYNVEWVLREDVARGPLAHELESFIYHFSRPGWCANKNLVKKYKKGTPEKIKPEWVYVSKYRYDGMADWCKKWFTKDYQRRRISYFGEVEYDYKVCIPEYYFVERRSKSYITHREILNPDLQSQIDQLKNLLERKFYKFETYKYSGIKSLTKEYHASDRAFNKRQLKKNMTSIQVIEYMDDEEYSKENYKDHDWCGFSHWAFNECEYRYAHRNNAKWMWW